MTGWTLFFTVVGVAFLIAQLFRLIELIERPAPRARTAGRTLPAAWNVRLWNALNEKKPWTFWRS